MRLVERWRRAGWCGTVPPHPGSNPSHPPLLQPSHPICLRQSTEADLVGKALSCLNARDIHGSKPIQQMQAEDGAEPVDPMLEDWLDAMQWLKKEEEDTPGMQSCGSAELQRCRRAEVHRCKCAEVSVQ